MTASVEENYTLAAMRNGSVGSLIYIVRYE